MTDSKNHSSIDDMELLKKGEAQSKLIGSGFSTGNIGDSPVVIQSSSSNSTPMSSLTIARRSYSKHHSLHRSRKQVIKDLVKVKVS